MRTANPVRQTAIASLLVLLSACGTGGGDTGAAQEHEKGEEQHASAEDQHAEGEEHADEGLVTLTAEQVRNAGIALVQPRVGGTAGSILVPATIGGDPQAVQVVSASIGGRLVALNRNLGQYVARGDALAIVESREAAQLTGEIEAARARLQLANSVLAREQRLFAERVSPEQDLIAARTAATEARIALRQAKSSLQAAGTAAGTSNRLAIRSPISGQVIARPAVLGQTVAADAELFRVANLSHVAVEFSLQPADAGRIAPGTPVTITAPGRRATGTVTFISPALDETTRLVPAIASLRNSGGVWRVGEAVQASLQLSASDDRMVTVPQICVQTVEGQAVVFVRTDSGFRVAPVRLGARSGAWVVVTSGLTGRESIAGTNSFTLKAEIGKGEAEHEH